MNRTYSDREIDLFHKELMTKLEVGFKGIHDRQDTTNGRIYKAEENIAKINEELLIAKQDVAKYLQVLSRNSGDVKVLQDEIFKRKEQRIDDLVSSLKRENEHLKKNRFSWVKYTLVILLFLFVEVLVRTDIIGIRIPLP